MLMEGIALLFGHQAQRKQSWETALRLFNSLIIYNLLIHQFHDMEQAAGSIQITATRQRAQLLKSESAEPTKEIWADPARSAHMPTALSSWRNW